MTHADARPTSRGLGQFASTAICGNDITSSCLYVSALSILYAGKWAPVALALVALVLYFYRSIYAEVVGAVPLNGGAYNALLNTTSKFRASFAACLTILSYMATAVISANEAMHYAHAGFEALPVEPATIALLALFAALTIAGITESARVAMAIFVFHLGTMGVLLVAGSIHLLVSGPAVLLENLGRPAPHGLAIAIFFGFSAAMLGISGFESSANFVEEQASGVFPKTLRNMWIAVTVLNPGMALLALALVPLAEVPDHQTVLLAHMGDLAVGPWLYRVVSLDAALVLSGAVLTSYVGANGLIHRMTLDRCLPQFLLKSNRRRTTHRIVIGFFLLAVSVLLITRGELKALAGVYTISFLGVMILFGLGNLLLKVRRAELPRPTRSTWVGTILGIVAVLVGLIGNIVMNPPYARVFLEYLIPTLLVVSIVLWRIVLLKGLLFVVRRISARLAGILRDFTQKIRTYIEEIDAQQVVFFTRGDNAANLNQALLYVRRNEHPRRIKIVLAATNPEEIPDRLARDLEFLDEVYPEIDIEFVVVEEEFSPELIRKLSHKWHVPINLMFIGSPGHGFPYNLAELGGVRLII